MSATEHVNRLVQWYDESPLNNLRLGILIIIGMLVFMVTGFTVRYSGTILLIFNVLIVNFVLYGILLLGLNLQYGYAGLVNFGPVLFFGVGAYTVAMVSAQSTFTEVGAGLPWYVGLAAAIVTTVVVAIVLGLSTIQLRADYLAIVTLAAAEIFHEVVHGVNYFGGATGIPGVPSLFADLAVTAKTAGLGAFVILSGLLLISYAIINRLGHSPFGRVLRSIRADAEASKSLGKNVFFYEFQAFIIGAILMGVAGAFLAFNYGSMSPGFITIDVTVLVWIGMLIGGAGNNRGVLGGLLIISSFQLFTRFGNQIFPIDSTTWASLRLIGIGMLLIIIVRYRPEGIWGDPDRLEAE